MFFGKMYKKYKIYKVVNPVAFEDRLIRYTQFYFVSHLHVRAYAFLRHLYGHSPFVHLRVHAQICNPMRTPICPKVVHLRHFFPKFGENRESSFVQN